MRKGLDTWGNSPSDIQLVSDRTEQDLDLIPKANTVGIISISPMSESEMLGNLAYSHINCDSQWQ